MSFLFSSEALAKDEQQSAKVKMVQSNRGIGPVTAVAMLVYTKGFTAFVNGNQMACYCGVVPFTKSSGTSVRYKSTVSPFPNKKLKKLLHLFVENPRILTPCLHSDLNVKMIGGRGSTLLVFPITIKAFLCL